MRLRASHAHQVADKLLAAQSFGVMPLRKQGKAIGGKRGIVSAGAISRTFVVLLSNSLT